MSLVTHEEFVQAAWRFALRRVEQTYQRLNERLDRTFNLEFPELIREYLETDRNATLVFFEIVKPPVDVIRKYCTLLDELTPADLDQKAFLMMSWSIGIGEDLSEVPKLAQMNELLAPYIKSEE